MNLIELDDFHWLMDILQTIDVGLVVIDRQYQVQLWNGFMENHSGQLATHIRGQNLLTQFPDLPVSWLQRKVEEVFALHSPVFSSWEQRPRLFDFSSTLADAGKNDFFRISARRQGALQLAARDNVEPCPFAGEEVKDGQV